MKPNPNKSRAHTRKLSSKRTSVKEEALRLAKLGWRIFPAHSVMKGVCSCRKADKCPHPGKHPRINRWQIVASSDLAKVLGWWKKWPSSNVGLLTGKEVGLFVIDVDPRKDGTATLKKLETKHGKLPPTVESRTGSGGEHRFFAYPAGVQIKSRNDGLGLGLDIKGNGGFVILPPSGHKSGDSYRWKRGRGPDRVPLAEAPAWLLDLVVEKEPKRKATGPRRGSKLFGQTINEGSRNDSLMSRGGANRAKGMTAPEILSDLMEVNRSRCCPPLTENEVAKIARSLSKYAQGTDNGTCTIGVAEADQRTTIRVNERNLDELTLDILTALEDANDPPVLYVRGGELCRVRTDENGRPVIEPLTDSTFRYRLAQVARFQGKGGVVLPSRDGVQNALAAGQWNFPSLEAIAEFPVIRSDGSVLDLPGYDAASRLLYAPSDKTAVPDVSRKASRTAARKAARYLLEELLGDFPFVDQASKANALALLLTPLIRQTGIGNCPIALIDAPVMGSGKTLLARVFHVALTGRDAPVMTAPTQEDEWSKQITALLCSGTNLVIIDNIEHRLASAKLSAAVTTSTWLDRPFRRNDIMISVPSRAVWIVTGNNIQLGGDMSRRCFSVRLDSESSKPWQRASDEFRHPDLIGWVMENREEILRAMLTVVSSWYQRGRPPGANAHPLGSFELWSETLGGILSHAGVTGFLGNLEEFYEQVDDTPQQWEGFFRSWHEKFESAPTTVDQIKKETTEQPEGTMVHSLPEILPGPEDAQFSRSLGQQLKKLSGRVFGDYTLQRSSEGKDRTGRTFWRVTLQSSQGSQSRIQSHSKKKKSWRKQGTKDSAKPAIHASKKRRRRSESKSEASSLDWETQVAINEAVETVKRRRKTTKKKRA